MKDDTTMKNIVLSPVEVDAINDQLASMGVGTTLLALLDRTVTSYQVSSTIAYRIFQGKLQYSDTLFSDGTWKNSVYKPGKSIKTLSDVFGFFGAKADWLEVGRLLHAMADAGLVGHTITLDLPQEYTHE